MDKLKQTFSRNKDSTEATDSADTTSKGAGQGSHFSSAKDVGIDSLGTTVTGQQDSAVGGTRSDPTAAQATAGPEAGGAGHIGTVSSDSQGTSSAAIGQTSTYSTHHLGKGDPVGSVADTQSTDPVSYQRPETATIGSAGVPPGSAQTAATRAFENVAGMPGGYPSSGTEYTNPYKAEKLDPRVDNLPIRSKDNNNTGGVAAAATGTVVGGGLASATSDRSSAQQTNPAPSSLTSTANPSDRSADYSQAERTRVPETATTSSGEQADTQQSSGFVGKALAAVGLGSVAGAAGYAAGNQGSKESAIPDTTPSSSAPVPSHSRKESIPTTAYPAGVDSPSPIHAPVGGTRPTESSTRGGPILEEHDRHTGPDATLGSRTEDSRSHDRGLATAGVAGAGVAAAGAGYAATRPHETSTSAGQSGVTPANHSVTTGPTESAPSRPADSAFSTQPDHTKRDAAATGAGGAALGGAAAYGGSRDRIQEPYGHTAIMGPDTSTTDAHPSSATAAHPQATSPQTGLGTQSTTTSSNPAVRDDDHTGRNAALAGVGGAGLAGAGAYGAHELSDRHARSDATAAQPQTTLPQTRLGTQSTTTSSNPAVRDDDHTGRNAALAGVGGAGLAGAGAYGAHELSDRHARSDATAAQPQTTSPQTGLGTQSTTTSSNPAVRDDDHTGRNAALAGIGGAGAVGAGAYGAHELSERNAEKERLAAEKARHEQAKAQQKEAEKQQKEAAKEAEKAEKKHEKEVEKAEKKHEKEVEKEEKAHQKEVAAMEKQRTKEEEHRQKELEKQRTKEEDEERRRKEIAGAAVGGTAVAGAGAAGYELNKDYRDPALPYNDKTEEKEKKPGLFKRIFKSRKNKDTGEDEQYSSDEEVDKHDSHKGAVAETAAGATAVGAGAYGVHEAREHETSNIGTAHTTDEPSTKYEAISGGNTKPSYNPLNKDPLHEGTTQPTSSSTDTSRTPYEPGIGTMTSSTAHPTTTSTDTTRTPYEPGVGTMTSSTAHPTTTSTDTTRTPYEPGVGTTAAGATAVGAGAYGAHEAREHESSNVGTAHPTSTSTSADPTRSTREPAIGTTSSTTAPQQVTTNPTAAAAAEKAIGDTDKSGLHIEPTLGLPYDPSKDPE